MNVAVGVEHLDAGRHVDDVELVLVVDRDRPRLAELPFAGAERAPHLLRLIRRRRLAVQPPIAAANAAASGQLAELAAINSVSVGCESVMTTIRSCARARPHARWFNVAAAIAANCNAIADRSPPSPKP